MKKLIVFGATSAIAQAYVNRVSKNFESIVLVARNAEQLENIGAHVKTVSGASVSTVVCDLSEVSAHAKLFNEGYVSGATCALISYGQLTDQDRSVAEPDYGMAQFNLNGTSTIALSAAVASVFAQQGGGVLAVVGSVAGDRGRKSNYYYGAAKSAVASFLSGLRSDMQSRGVTVITIKPGFVDTPMTSEFKKGLLWASADKVASDIETAIDKKRSVLYTPWFWRYIMLIIKLVPEFIFKKLPL